VVLVLITLVVVAAAVKHPMGLQQEPEV